MANYRSLIPIMAGYTDESTGIKVSASSEYTSSGYIYPAYSAFDGKISGSTNYIYHRWEPKDSREDKSPYFIIDFNTNRYCVRKFSIVSVKSQQPSSISIQASNDSLVWENIYGIQKFEVIKDETLQYYEFDNKRRFRYYKINLTRVGGTGGMYIYEMQLHEDLAFEHPKSLLKQNSNYYSIKSNLYKLGRPIDNTQLEQWYKKYGVDYANILTENLLNREMPMTLDKTTGIWKTDFELDASNITDNIELLENDNEKSNYKIIKYESPQYRIYDLLDNEFEIMMLE